MKRALATAACGALAAGSLAVGAAPAVASRTQLSVFEDDLQLVMSTAAVRERTLDDLAILGADTIHSIVFWNKVAPEALSRSRPAGFDGSDPSSYPPELWDRYDGLVRGAAVRDIDLLLSPSSPLPLWASRCKGGAKVRRVCRPDLTQFKRFVQALGKRYSGEHPDENEGRGPLPRVSRWSVWNEPNLGSWLSPQSAKVNGRLMPQSPAIYRELVRAAIKGLRASGHANDDILFGETAPLGRKTGAPSVRPLTPGDFLRGVLCIDDKGKALTGAQAAALDCKGGYARLGVTGMAHHPYTRGGSRSPTSKAAKNEITISSVARLKDVLRDGAARRRIPGSLPIFYTEFGFQTNPPDDIFGVSLARQAEWLNQSDWIAWRDPRIRSVAQYELRDEANPAAFQTGLRFLDGRPKPGFAAYRLPIWVTRLAGNKVRVWGQVRPAEDDAAETVEIQQDRSGSGAFETVAQAPVNRKGYVYASVPRSGGTWRLRWTPKDGGAAVLSRVAKVAAR
jgi:hypothetical protein